MCIKLICTSLHASILSGKMTQTTQLDIDGHVHNSQDAYNNIMTCNSEMAKLVQIYNIMEWNVCH